MSKLVGKIRNVTTKQIAKTFTSDYIDRQRSGEHNGEPMERVANRIMSDPNIAREATKDGKYDLVYKKDGKDAIIGWIGDGVGEISQKAYDNLQKNEFDGVYAVKIAKTDEYAVRIWNKEKGYDGKYLIKDMNQPGTGEPQYEEGHDMYVSADPKEVAHSSFITKFPFYEAAALEAHRVASKLNMLPSYSNEDISENDEYDEDFDEGEGHYDPERSGYGNSDIPSSGGYDPRMANNPYDETNPPVEGYDPRMTDSPSVNGVDDMDDGFERY